MSPQDLSDAYTVDFRDRGFDSRMLVPLGHDSLYGLQLLKPEPRGLRIIIPSHQGRMKPNVGVAPTLEIHGDFEITAGYDLVTAETPTRGAGAGANIYLLASGTREAATLRRCVSPQGKHVYFLHWTVRDEAGKPGLRYKYIPAGSRTGQLRLARFGSTLVYSAADGSGELRELHRVEFGTSPIGLMRLEANTDGSSTTVDVVWDGISIRAGKLRSIQIPLYNDATTANAGRLEHGAPEATSAAK